MLNSFDFRPWFRLAFLFAAGLLLLAHAHASTQVTATYQTPAGDLLTGTCTIQPVGPWTPTAGAQVRIVGPPVIVGFADGVFSVRLAPTDSATPSGQYYIVNCQVPKQRLNGHTISAYTWGPKYWLVPTSGTALDVSAVESITPPGNSTVNLITGFTGGTCIAGQLMAQLPDGSCLPVATISSGGTTWAGVLTTWAAETHTWATI